MRMPDTQNAEVFQLERAGVAQLLALRSPSDKSLFMIISLFILMLIIQSFKDSKFQSCKVSKFQFVLLLFNEI